MPYFCQKYKSNFKYIKLHNSMKHFIHIIITACLLGFSYLSQAQQQDNKGIISNESINLYTYPNPVVNKLNVKLSSNLKQQVYKVEIVNVVGKKLREQQLLDRNTTELSFNDLDDIPQGVYLVIARDEYGKILQSNKFLISK